MGIIRQWEELTENEHSITLSKIKAHKWEPSSTVLVVSKQIR
jgi:hypothetical protein